MSPPMNGELKYGQPLVHQSAILRNGTQLTSECALSDPADVPSPIIDISKNLNALILQQMQATPDLVALEDKTATFTYAELDAKVSVLADRLRKQGVTRDSLVGVLLGRSAN